MTPKDTAVKIAKLACGMRSEGSAGTAGVEVSSCVNCADGGVVLRLRSIDGSSSVLPPICEALSERLPLNDIHMAISEMDGNREIVCLVDSEKCLNEKVWRLGSHKSRYLETASTVTLLVSLLLFLMGLV